MNKYVRRRHWAQVGPPVERQRNAPLPIIAPKECQGQHPKCLFNMVFDVLGGGSRKGARKHARTDSGSAPDAPPQRTQEKIRCSGQARPHSDIRTKSCVSERWDIMTKTKTLTSHELKLVLAYHVQHSTCDTNHQTEVYICCIFLLCTCREQDKNTSCASYVAYTHKNTTNMKSIDTLHIYIYIYIYIYTHVYICMYAHVDVRANSKHTYMYAYIIYVYIYIYTCTCLQMFIHIGIDT